jgi:hypothetical protein
MPIYRVVVGASCTLNISFKHTTGDYLDAELRTRKPQEPVKLTIDYTQLNSNRDIGINLGYMVLGEHYQCLKHTYDQKDLCAHCVGPCQNLV